MNNFIQQHASDVTGTLSGFDRIRFRGTLRWLCYGSGLGRALTAVGIQLKNFKEHTQAVTARLRASILSVAENAGRPVEYLSQSSISKEAYARQIAERDGIREGLIAVLYAVEPCMSFRVGTDKTTGHIEVENAYRKCSHYYSYWLDPVFGFCHVRIQSWYPMNVYVCINGREWLARQMDRAGLAYRRRENCFVGIDDDKRAQALCDRQLKTNWSSSLNRLLTRSFPHYRRVIGIPRRLGYYWSANATEWATDVMFKSPKALSRLYPQLIAHGMRNFSSREVLRFLGRRVPLHGGLYGQFDGEVTTDLRQRPEGMRIKHRIDANSIKMYDKQGSVLRVETTINNTEDFKCYRAKEDDPEGEKKWLPMRKGVADMHRRAQVSQASNERYLESLATIDEKTPLGQLTNKLCQPVQWKGKRVRALNPLSAPDADLLGTVNRGEFSVNGFRNRDLHRHLYKGTRDAATRRKQSAAITRRLTLLRAHGLIRKVQHTHRYVLTRKGKSAINALLVARSADTKALSKNAA